MIPRPEYPRPQFVREGWLNLNGSWRFEIDHGASGRARGLTRGDLKGEITVPFCPESKLSGVQYTDFMRAVWYAREFRLPPEAAGKRVLLHFGAVDYKCEAWVNGVSVGVHEGGYTSFSFDITGALKPDDNTLVVCADDETRSPLQPGGKQSDEYASYGCSYTRTTGIWQTVWLEWVNESYLAQVFYTPDAANDTLTISAVVRGGKGCRLSVETFYNEQPTGGGEFACNPSFVGGQIAVAGGRHWSPGHPALYDVTLTLKKDGIVVDRMTSYFGLRSVGFDGMRFLLNGKPVFQRLVLDQGFYPDGIYTAPTDDELKNDILRAQAMGFNGARLHQKVFEARFLYHADRLGYLCWGEMANWGLDAGDPAATDAFLKEWIPAVERDYSAPSVIGWCPFNETWDVHGRRQRDDLLRAVYRVTKAMDRTRPCIDTSGNYHAGETDVYDVHDYEQQPDLFAAHYGKGAKPIYERLSDRQTYPGNLPVFVSEYGGIWWSDTDTAGWGYGERVNSREEFLARFQGLTDALLDNPDHFGLCYTQLTDVEQEQNGLYTYDRKPKFDPAVISAVLTRRAACEEEDE